MATPIIMPRQGQSVESCIIGKWHKKKGDKVEIGDILFTYETDKSTFDEESKAAGILLDIFFEEGDDVPVLTNVCVIGEAGESTDTFNPRGGKKEETVPQAAEPVREVQKPAAELPPQENVKAVPVIMPRQGQSVESCIIGKWHKKKGDKVQEGDLLFTYETDKATFDEEAKTSGTLLDIFFEEGDDVPVLTNVCVIGEEGENAAVFNPHQKEGAEQGKAASAASEAPARAQEVGAVLQEQGQPQQNGERIKISPRARNAAERLGVDVRYAVPTGPYGRIIEQDILTLRDKGPVVTSSAREEYLQKEIGTVTGTGLGGRITTGDLQEKAAPSTEIQTKTEAPANLPEVDYEDVKLTNIRKVIAKAMHQSLASSAQLTLNTSFDASDILDFRKKLKANKEKMGLENITLNDIILYAVSRTILQHPSLNAHFMEDKMRIYKNVHLGIAVDTERGLMVPTLFHANKKSLNDVSREAKGLIEGCQKGTISPDVLKGASFTITNLGSLDIESFTPVLNPPQTGILGVNTIVQRAKEVNGEMVYYPAMGLSLTFDHRAVDGAPAARFLKDLKTNLENFSVLLVK